ncbi:aldose epimerase family protein [Segeticoccus rhizosphaerae]|jgi:aldose 1-epimerase|uniref:aldose epimerase family protein n=1 Tax=Segeticoccus rhizosphaerae TaxID=1104777 RepID=UPI00192E65CC|nr:aldose epimerase family protein [Ornithinicoccus soli]
MDSMLPLTSKARFRIIAAPAAVFALALAGAAGTAQTSSAATPEANAHCQRPTVAQEFFGKAFDLYASKKLPVYRYTLRNCNGVSARILSYGGIVQSIDVPGQHGRTADVVLGFKTLDDYVAEASPRPPATGGVYFGEIIGRYGNRIADGTFTLDGHTYTLPINNGVNSLHGGFVGFGNHVWASQKVHQHGAAGVRLELVSPDGDDGANVGCVIDGRTCTGFPGKLSVTVTYTLDSHNRLSIHYHATVAGKPTVLNLTNHSYFNLAGESSGDVYDQKVAINANSYTPTDDTQIPTGAIAPVAGTPFDFRSPHTIGSRINESDPQLILAHGYDHNWVLNDSGPKLHGLNRAARAWDPESGRKLTVWTDQPGVQFYTGNYLDGTLVGISGHTYRQSDGYTFETQHFPDSPNQPKFPSTVLKPGQQFNSTTIFEFSHS